MFEMLKYKCQICGGYTDWLLPGDRCGSCSYTPTGRPIWNGGWDAHDPVHELDLPRLLEAAGVSAAVRPDDEDEED